MEKHETHKVTMPTIGRKYHIKWAKKFSMVWRLIAIDGNTCHLKTKYGKSVTCRIDELLEINRNVILYPHNKMETLTIKKLSLPIDGKEVKP